LSTRNNQEIAWALCALNRDFRDYWNVAGASRWEDEMKEMQCLIARGEAVRGPKRRAAPLTHKEAAKVDEKARDLGWSRLRIFENGYVCDFYKDKIAMDVVPGNSLSLEKACYLQVKQRQLSGHCDYSIINS
jgi:hypothetical protein